MDSIEKQIYLDALELWGEELQLAVLQEECAEVIVAVSKLGRRQGEPKDLHYKLAEEIADVEIMISQARVMGLGWLIDRHKAMKLQRLCYRINAAKAGMEASDG